MPTVRVPIADGPAIEVDLDGGTGPVAALGHGATTTPEFLRRCLEAPLHELGWRLATWDARGHGRRPVRNPALLSLDHHARDLGAVADATGARLVGGISLGAHAGLAWALGQPPGRLDGLLLACPAWSGPPGAVAGANAALAAQLETLGPVEALRRVQESSPAWIAAEVGGWWARHDADALAAALRALALSTSPEPEQLGGLEVRAAVVALTGDPLHPAEVAEAWAAALPRSGLARLTLSDLGESRASLGEALVRAWGQAPSC